MKLSKKLSIFTLLLFLSVIFTAPVRADAATVGQQLKNPETGWQRIDDKDPLLIYKGTWQKSLSNADRWLDSAMYCNGGSTSTLTFKFYGSKIRLIGEIFTNKPSNNIIIIDNQNYTFSEYGNGFARSIVYENLNLEMGIHNVTIKTPSDMTIDQNLVVDAVDIDSTGYLVEYYPLINLVAAQGNEQVSLSWGAIEDATSYNVKRSSVQGGPYELVATTSSTTYTDTNLINGTSYYYIVSANISGKEKSTSNEASVTPIAATNPDYLGNYATLVIEMTNGGIKEYSLPIVDIDNFITWYDNKSDGTGKSYYTFTKLSNIVPYLRIKEYISFDKISSFEVKEFNQ